MHLDWRMFTAEALAVRRRKLERANDVQGKHVPTADLKLAGHLLSSEMSRNDTLSASGCLL